MKKIIKLPYEYLIEYVNLYGGNFEIHYYKNSKWFAFYIPEYDACLYTRDDVTEFESGLQDSVSLAMEKLALKLGYDEYKKQLNKA